MNWRQLGLSFMLRGENVIDGQTYSETKQEIFTRYGNAGWSPYVMFGVGVLSVYDTRDNLFYPQKYGNFFKVAFLNYNKFIGSSFNVNSFNVDFRQYLPTFLSQMFVYQLYLDCRLGNDIPFQMLPSVGGVDNMRGFREKIFVDNTFFQFQTEYRVLPSIRHWHEPAPTGFRSPSGCDGNNRDPDYSTKPNLSPVAKEPQRQAPLSASPDRCPAIVPIPETSGWSASSQGPA